MMQHTHPTCGNFWFLNVYTTFLIQCTIIPITGTHLVLGKEEFTMTDKARQLLKKLASEYDQNHRDEFDSCFYLSYPKPVIDELEENECITRKNNIIGSIILTQSGYEEATR